MKFKFLNKKLFYSIISLASAISIISTCFSVFNKNSNEITNTNTSLQNINSDKTILNSDDNNVNSNCTNNDLLKGFDRAIPPSLDVPVINTTSISSPRLMCSNEYYETFNEIPLDNYSTFDKVKQFLLKYQENSIYLQKTPLFLNIKYDLLSRPGNLEILDYIYSDTNGFAYVFIQLHTIMVKNRDGSISEQNVNWFKRIIEIPCFNKNGKLNYFYSDVVAINQSSPAVQNGINYFQQGSSICSKQPSNNPSEAILSTEAPASYIQAFRAYKPLYNSSLSSNIATMFFDPNTSELKIVSNFNPGVAPNSGWTNKPVLAEQNTKSAFNVLSQDAVNNAISFKFPKWQEYDLPSYLYSYMKMIPIVDENNNIQEFFIFPAGNTGYSNIAKYCYIFKIGKAAGQYGELIPFDISRILPDIDLSSINGYVQVGIRKYFFNDVQGGGYTYNFSNFYQIMILINSHSVLNCYNFYVNINEDGTYTNVSLTQFANTPVLNSDVMNLLNFDIFNARKLPVVYCQPSGDFDINGWESILFNNAIAIQIPISINKLIFNLINGHFLLDLNTNFLLNLPDIENTTNFNDAQFILGSFHSKCEFNIDGTIYKKYTSTSNKINELNLRQLGFNLGGFELDCDVYDNNAVYTPFDRSLYAHSINPDQSKYIVNVYKKSIDMPNTLNNYRGIILIDLNKNSYKYVNSIDRNFFGANLCEIKTGIFDTIKYSIYGIQVQRNEFNLDNLPNCFNNWYLSTINLSPIDATYWINYPGNEWFITNYIQNKETLMTYIRGYVEFLSFPTQREAHDYFYYPNVLSNIPVNLNNFKPDSIIFNNMELSSSGFNIDINTTSFSDDGEFNESGSNATLKIIFRNNQNINNTVSIKQDIWNNVICDKNSVDNKINELNTLNQDQLTSNFTINTGYDYLNALIKIIPGSLCVTNIDTLNSTADIAYNVNYYLQAIATGTNNPKYKYEVIENKQFINTVSLKPSDVIQINQTISVSNSEFTSYSSSQIVSNVSNNTNLGQKFINFIKTTIANNLKKPDLANGNTIIINPNWNFNTSNGTAWTYISIPCLNDSRFINIKITVENFRPFTATSISYINSNINENIRNAIKPSLLQEFLNEKWYNIYYLVGINNGFSSGTQEWIPYILDSDGFNYINNPSFNQTSINGYDNNKIQEINNTNTNIVGNVLEYNDQNHFARVEITIKNFYSNNDNVYLNPTNNQPNPYVTEKHIITFTNLFSTGIKTKPKNDFVVDNTYSAYTPGEFIQKYPNEPKNQLIKNGLYNPAPNQEIKLIDQIENNKDGEIYLIFNLVNALNDNNVVINPSQSLVFYTTITGFSHTLPSKVTFTPVINSSKYNYSDFVALADSNGQLNKNNPITMEIINKIINHYDFPTNAWESLTGKVVNFNPGENLSNKILGARATINLNIPWFYDGYYDQGNNQTPKRLYPLTKNFGISLNLECNDFYDSSTPHIELKVISANISIGNNAWLSIYDTSLTNINEIDYLSSNNSSLLISLITLSGALCIALIVIIIYVCIKYKHK